MKNIWSQLRKIKVSSVVRTFIVMLTVAFGIWFTTKALGNYIVEFIAGRHYLIEFLVIFIAAGYFPLTYIAYQSFRQPIRIIRLRSDFQFLGYQEGEADRLYTHSQDPWSYWLYIAMTMLLTIIGMGLFFWSADTASVPPMFLLPLTNLPLSNTWIDPNTVQALRYGFLGAYLFSAYLIYRRYTTDDLQPNVYLYSALTIIAAFIFNYVAFEAIFKLADTENTSTITGIPGGVFAILAFSLGYFPNLAIRWFNQVAYSALKVDPRHIDALPLSLIDGISQWHEARLRDNGIDNIQNLAAVELRDLLVSTTFDAQQVVDWVDQSILYIYLDQNEIASFRRAGIRLISDFQKLCATAKKDPQATENLAKQLQITKERLETLFEATQSGPNLHRVLDYWSRARLHSRQLQDKLIDTLKELDNNLEQARDATSGYPPEIVKLLGGLGDLLAAAVENPRPHVRVSIGNLYALCAGKHYQTGEYRNKALKCYTQALEDDPTYARAYSRRALVTYYSGRPLEAIPDYEKAIVLRPDDYPLNHNNLAWIQSHSSNPPLLEEALKHATKAVEVSSDQAGDPDPAFLDTLASIQLLLAQKEPLLPKKLKLLNEACTNLLKIQFVDRIPDYGRIEIIKNQDGLIQQYLTLLKSNQGTDECLQIVQSIEQVLKQWVKLSKMEPFESSIKSWKDRRERVDQEEQMFKEFKQLAKTLTVHVIQQINDLKSWPEDHRKTLEEFSKAVGAIHTNGETHKTASAIPV